MARNSASTFHGSGHRAAKGTSWALALGVWIGVGTALSGCGGGGGGGEGGGAAVGFGLPDAVVPSATTPAAATPAASAPTGATQGVDVASDSPLSSARRAAAVAHVGTLYS